MARYSINDTTLIALSNAIRAKFNVAEGALLKYHKENVSMISQYEIDLNGAPNNRFRVNLTNMHFQESASGAYLAKISLTDSNKKFQSFDLGQNDTDWSNVIDVYARDKKIKIQSFSQIFYVDIDIECVDSNNENYIYTPEECIEKINSLTMGPTEEELIFTGSMNYRFAQNNWNWYLDKYKDLLSSKDIKDLSNMCWYSDQLYEIPFDLNCNSAQTCPMSSVFYNCTRLLVPPMIHNAKPNNMDDMFARCERMVKIPEGFGEDWDWSINDGGTGPYGGAQKDGMFNTCRRLRKLPMILLAHGNPYTNSGYAVFKNLAQNCNALDEIINMPNPHPKATFADTSSYNNVFQYMVDQCYRLKDFTFAPMEPPQWANQVLDFSINAGWGYYSSMIYPDYIDRTDGVEQLPEHITADKEVKDAETYEALKNDPNWWSRDVAYSRYNHDSAVRTINSLPDCSAFQASSGGKANIIKFKGAAGSATDGGAINTLTEEEIAVAAAKGWTVSLV